VDGVTLGMGARGEGAASSGHSCGVPGFAPALGSGTDFWVVRTKPGLSKDYEFLPETEEALIYLGMVRLMLRRLTKTS
jgi:hypothetical protein